MILRQSDRYKNVKCPCCNEEFAIEILGKQCDSLRKNPVVHKYENDEEKQYVKGL